MKFQLAVLSVFCAAVSVNAFAPQLPQAGHLSSALSSAAAPAEADASTDEAASNILKPEYQAAV